METLDESSGCHYRVHSRAWNTMGAKYWDLKARANKSQTRRWRERDEGLRGDVNEHTRVVNANNNSP
jgi:hypothetical protein